MKCNKIKKLILTDYIDDQIRVDVKKKIDKHLENCLSCKNFFIQLRRSLDTLEFKKLEYKVDFDRIWQGIEEKLEKSSVNRNFTFNFDLFLFLRRLAPVVVSFCIVTVVVLNSISKRRLIYEFFDEQINFFTQLYSKKSLSEYLKSNFEIENYIL